MNMIFCRGCGKEIHETANTCPHCGAPQGNAKANNKSQDIPEGVKGWSWGAFLLNWVWAIGNKTWIGLLAFVPYVGFIMAIILGFKGREWAWKNKDWDSIDHFNEVQKKWSFWGVTIVAIFFALGIIAAIAIPAYESYSERAAKEASDQIDIAQLLSNQSAQESEPSPTPEAQEKQDSNQLYKWKSGWGQGVTEYSSEDGNGNSLYIACPNDEKAVSAIASINGIQYESGSPTGGFTVIVDGEEFSDPFNTDCRVCANNFPIFWEKLRKANNIKISANNSTAIIPTRDIEKTIPAFDSTDNSCRVAF